MSIKEELQEMRTIRKLIDCKIKQIKELEDSKTSIKSPRITGLPKGRGTSNVNKLDKIIDKINKLQDSKTEQLDELLKLESKYNKAVDSLCPMDKLIIELRYYDNENYTWEEIADKIGYDIRHIYNLHGQALLNLKKAING